MGRRKSFSDEALLLALRENDFSAKRAALALGVSTVAIYTRIKRLPVKDCELVHEKMATAKRPALVIRMDLLKSLRGDVTLGEVAEANGLSSSTARRAIWTAALQFCAEHQMPIAKSINEFRVFRELLLDPSLAEDVPTLAAAAGVSVIFAKKSVSVWNKERKHAGKVGGKVRQGRSSREGRPASDDKRRMPAAHGTRRRRSRAAES